MNDHIPEDSLENILKQYSESFATKEFGKESEEVDDLMLVFGLTQAEKARNKQYWGRELGMCWQHLITELFQERHNAFGNAIREGADELCDLIIAQDAIDTKYRIGSGDAGTLKKFRQYGARLRQLGFRPIMLILRNDNLPSVLTSCRNSGWDVLVGDQAYTYILRNSGFDLHSWLRARKHKYSSKVF